ncbi:MAG: type I phosphomannose isomerase catalytic subunit, partial [Chloroflexota bacterium]
RIGESWEAFSGSLVTNGTWQGHSLGLLYDEYPLELAGEISKSHAEFPLLVKFIDARENLSVQVHPDDALARTLENYRSGKSEMWYVMEAEPEAHILYGLNDKVTSLEQLSEALKQGTLLEYVSSIPIKAGDVVYLPSRTIHALCQGVVVYELQQESDITYRLYDWGRQGREIHHEKGLQAINLETHNLKVSHPAPLQHEGFASVTLVECPYFTNELVEISDQLKSSERAEGTDKGRSFTLLTVLSGAGAIVSPSNAFAAEAIHKGDTFLLPANLSYTLKASTTPEPLRVILAQANS